jgi:acyl-CoA synthetase (AMP-forming)/AMP-acid ligase II
MLVVLGKVDSMTSFAALFQHDGKVEPMAINAREDTAVILYTSGTTGPSKGVMLTHRNLLANALQIKAWAGHLTFSPEDVVLGVTPFSHPLGLVIDVQLSLICGCTLVTMPRFEPAQFLQLFQKYRVTLTTVAPPIVRALAKHPLVDNYDLSSLRLAVSGFGPLSKAVAEAFTARLGCQVLPGYGLVEAAAIVCVRPLTSGVSKPGSVGLALPNTELQLVDVVTGEGVGPGVLGELWLRGPQVMKGYLNDPDATAVAPTSIAPTAVTIDTNGWLHTGDMGMVDADGYFYVVDRLKELIVCEGFQVVPAELEAVLLGHTAVADVCVIGKPDEEAGEIPKAFIVLKAAAQPEEILAYVAGRVAPYKKIREIEFVDTIPKSPTGKILRRVLMEQERERGTAVM